MFFSAFLKDADECRNLLKEESGKTEFEGPRTHRSLHDFAEKSYLSQLTFVRTNPKIQEKGLCTMFSFVFPSRTIHTELTSGVTIEKLLFSAYRDAHSNNYEY